jgi:hypothetical protein
MRVVYQEMLERVAGTSYEFCSMRLYLCLSRLTHVLEFMLFETGQLALTKSLLYSLAGLTALCKAVAVQLGYAGAGHS